MKSLKNTLLILSLILSTGAAITVSAAEHEQNSLKDAPIWENSKLTTSCRHTANHTYGSLLKHTLDKYENEAPKEAVFIREYINDCKGCNGDKGINTLDQKRYWELDTQLENLEVFSDSAIYELPTTSNAKYIDINSIKFDVRRAISLLQMLSFHQNRNHTKIANQ